MPTIDFEARVKTTLQSIEGNPDIHPDNKAAIREFKRDLKLEGLSDAWLQKLTSHLKVIAEHLGDTRFQDMEKEDLKDLVEWVQSRDIADATVNAYKQVIKRFWRWQADLPRGDHPEETDWINTSNHAGKDTLPDDLLTREDIDALLDACRNTRDRAFIVLLWETGARIGELIDLTVGDIEDHQHGRKIVVDGKTGPRRIPLLESTPAINKWLNEHPAASNKQAPLWCQLRNGNNELSYHYIRQKLLVRPGKRAAKQNPSKFADNENAVDDPEVEIKFHKPLNPHHFRHSRATYMANEFTEAQLCEWFGWVQASNVPAKYVHLSGRDIDDAYNQLHGLEPEDDTQQERSVQDCDRCGELNEPDAGYCVRCGFALDQKRALPFEEQVNDDVKKDYAETAPGSDQQDKLDTLDNLLEDPEVKAALLEKMGE